MLRRIAIALVAVGILATGLWWVGRKEDREARAERAQSRLPAFDARAVTAFTVETRSGPYRVVRAGAGWRVTAPVDDAASAAAVEAFLAAARTTPVLQALESPDALASYGLEPPVARLKVEGVDVPPLEIGDVAPAGDGLFARVPGRGGVLILKLPEGQALVAPDVGRLRDASVVDLERSGITAIDIAPGGIRLARGGDAWWIESPRRFPAAPTQVDKLLAAIFAAKVVGSDDTGSFTDPRFGLGAAALHVTLHAAGASREVVIGGEAGEGRRFLTSEGRKTVLVVETPAPSTLPVAVDALRDTRLTNVNRYAVTRFTYAAGGKRFAAAKKDEETWTSETGSTVRSDDVYALLVRLLEAPTTAWSEGTLSGSPGATLEYATASGETGRLGISGDRAAWSGLPGVWFRLGAPAPPVP